MIQIIISRQFKSNKYRKILVLLVLVMIKNLDCVAIGAKGYIVNLQSDTIYGWVQLSKFDQVTGGLVLNGIEEESFHSRVVFITNDGIKFKTYFPEMLLGFGFTYNSTNYVYRQIKIKRKSIFKSEQFQYRFMRLIDEGKFGSRYKDVQISPNPGLQINEDEHIKYNSNLFRIKRNSKEMESKDTLKKL